MPKGSKVEEMYQAIKRDSIKGGMKTKDAKTKAAKISQAKTGKSLATGKTPKSKVARKKRLEKAKF